MCCVRIVGAWPEIKRGRIKAIHPLIRGREGFDGLVTGVIDGELIGLNAKVVLSVGLQPGVAPNGEAGGVTILSDGEATPALRVELGRDGESKLRSASSDPKLPVVGILERGRTTTEHMSRTSCFSLGLFGDATEYQSVPMCAGDRTTRVPPHP